MIIPKDLCDVLEPKLFNHPDCFDSRRYWRWESEIATPALVEKGFTVGVWYSAEEDSFGPLIRAVRLTRGKVSETYFYG